jgi:hypothetical protein
MTKLNQIIAIEKTANSQSQSVWTRVYQNLKARSFFDGRARTYEPLDPDNGEQFPDESQLVQLRVEDILRETSKALTRLFNVIATKDWANTRASADVKLPDGTVLLEKVPVTYLLFLERRLAELHAFVGDIPVVDPAKKWEYSSERGLFATDIVHQIKTKKLPRRDLVWVPPSPEYKQDPKWETWQEDTLVGHWNTIFLSGATSAERKQELIDRVETLQVAVKNAREEANNLDVTDQTVGKRIFDYLFAE